MRTLTTVETNTVTYLWFAMIKHKSRQTSRLPEYDGDQSSVQHDHLPERSQPSGPGVLQFMYLGRAKFDQDKTDDFIKLAIDLEVKEISKIEDLQYNEFNDLVETKHEIVIVIIKLQRRVVFRYIFSLYMKV